MKTLLLTLTTSALILTGCTRVGVREPIGTLLPPEDAQSLSGTWVDPDGKQWVARYDTEEHLYTVTHYEKEEQVRDTFQIRELDRETAILWFRDTEIEAYIPLRILPPTGEDVKVLTLLFPDEEEVERLVEAGSIQGGKHPTKDAWILESDGLAKQLLGKRFWRLDTSMPLLRQE